MKFILKIGLIVYFCQKLKSTFILIHLKQALYIFLHD
jgi:hypothetical protein